MTTAFRRFWFTVIVALGGIGLSILLIDHLSPFDLDKPPNMLTRWQLQVLKYDAERCYAALDRNDVDYQRAWPELRESGCGYDDGVRLNRSDIRYGSRILLRCSAMLGILLWERQVLIPAAERYFERRVTGLRHLGTYACRPILRQKGRPLSQHAFANAIDIAGFTLEGGQVVSIYRDWNDEGERGAFLREIRDGACRIFGVVLSPDHDRAHANHFHFDMSFSRVCR